jgi:hypothetical protein
MVGPGRLDEGDGAGEGSAVAGTQPVGEKIDGKIHGRSLAATPSGGKRLHRRLRLSLPRTAPPDPRPGDGRDRPGTAAGLAATHGLAAEETTTAYLGKVMTVRKPPESIPVLYSRMT